MTTTYADGTAIPLIENTTEWEALSTLDKAYCWYNNDIDNRDVYGGLYTWAAAMNGSASSNANPSGIQGVCPDGWHLPSDAEWKQLEIYLGMSEASADSSGFRGFDEGGKLKMVGTTLWWTPNLGATNSTGFTALPGGIRFEPGFFNYRGRYGDYWSSSTEWSLLAYRRSLENSESRIQRGAQNRDAGISVRCLKD